MTEIINEANEIPLNGDIQPTAETEFNSESKSSSPTSASIPAAGSFLKRSSSKPPVTNEQNGVDLQQSADPSPPPVFNGNSSAFSAFSQTETVVQRGDKFPSTWSESAEGDTPKISQPGEIDFKPDEDEVDNEEARDIPSSLAPSQGSFAAAASPLARHRSLEINFSPGGSELPTAAPPKQGSFLERELKNGANQNPVDHTKDIEFSPAPDSPDSPVLAPIIPQPGSFVDKSKHQPLDENAKTSAQNSAKPMEINFSPGASDLKTAPPPSQGSFVSSDSVSSVNSNNEGSQRKRSSSGMEINFSPGGSDLPTGPPPKVGSFVDKTNSNPPGPVDPKDIFFEGEKEINFSPGGSDLRTAAPPKQGSFVERKVSSERKIQPFPSPSKTVPGEGSPKYSPPSALADESFVLDNAEESKPLKMQTRYDDIQFTPETSASKVEVSPASQKHLGSKEVAPNVQDSDDELELDELDRSKWKAEKEAKEVAISRSNSHNEDDEKSESDDNSEEVTTGAAKLISKSESSGGDDDFKPHDSILKLEAILESGLKSDLSGSPKTNQLDLLPKALSTDTGDTPTQDEATRKMDALFETALTGFDDDEESIDADKAVESTKNKDDQGVEGENTTPKSNSTPDNDDFVPSQSISHMEKMLDAALHDDMDLDDLFADVSSSQAKEEEPFKTAANTSPIKADNDSLSDLDNFLDQALDDDLDDLLGESPPKPVAAAPPKAQTIKPKPKPASIRPKQSSTATRGTRRNGQNASNATTIAPRVQSSKGSKITTSRTNTASRASASRANLAAKTKKSTARIGVTSKIQTNKPPTRLPVQAGTKEAANGRKPIRDEKKTTMFGMPKLLATKKKESAAVTRKPPTDKIKPDRKDRAKQFFSNMFSGTKKSQPESTTSPDNREYRAAQSTRDLNRPISKPKPKRLFSAPSMRPSAVETKQQTKPRKVKSRVYEGGISTASSASISSPQSNSSYSSPRRKGHAGCQAKFQPCLHASKGACELCVYFLSDDDRAMLDASGRHYRVMQTSGGCCKSCEVFPRAFDEPAARLCRACFHNTHREVYKKVVPKRNILRKIDV